MNSRQQPCIIYILECEKDKYYIGRTKNFNGRYQQHLNGNGSAWTRLYKPISIINVLYNCDVFDEDKYTLKYMSMYGIDNVRGGSFSTITIDYPTHQFIKRLISGATDNCYKCGKHGHFISQCNATIASAPPSLQASAPPSLQASVPTSLQASAPPSLQASVPDCFICKKIGHTAFFCIERTTINGDIITQDMRECCYRCGHNGHSSLTCRNNIDIFNRQAYYIVDDVKECINDILLFFK